jgi:hypothetical protein
MLGQLGSHGRRSGLPPSLGAILIQEAQAFMRAHQVVIAVFPDGVRLVQGHDPSDRAYHGLHFYFICRPKTLRLLADDQVDDGSAEQPRWVEIRGLHPEDFQIHGDVVLELCKQAAA